MSNEEIKQQTVTLEWDDVYDAAAAAYCRSEASRKALRLCFQTRDQTTQISIGWLPAAQRQPLTDEQIRDLWSWSATAEAEHTANTQQHAFARAIEAAHGIGENK
jgi:hypothetical protein